MRFQRCKNLVNMIKNYNVIQKRRYWAQRFPEIAAVHLTWHISIKYISIYIHSDFFHFYGVEKRKISFIICEIIKKNVFKKIQGKRCKIFIYKFLMKAFERSKDVIRALIEKRNDFEVYINCIYKFKVF